MAAKRGQTPGPSGSVAGAARGTGTSGRGKRIMSETAVAGKAGAGALYLERQGLKRFAGATARPKALPR